MQNLIIQPPAPGPGAALPPTVTLHTPTEVKQYLQNLQPQALNNGNTPHLNSVVYDLMGHSTVTNFTTGELVNQVKRRSWGHRFAHAMRAAAVNAPDLQRDHRDQFELDYRAESARIRALNDEIDKNNRGIPAAAKTPRLSAPTRRRFHITWDATHPTTFKSYGKAFRWGLKKTCNYSGFQWLMNRVPDPPKLNCWECVLYYAVDCGLANRDYVKWAVDDSNQAMATHCVTNLAQFNRINALGGNARTYREEEFFTGGNHLLNFLNEIRLHPFFFSTVLQPSAHYRDRKLYPALPMLRQVPAGMVVSCNHGGHVALVTGRVAQIHTPDARQIYRNNSNRGIEIVELDGTIDAVLTITTLEDLMFHNGGYRKSIHIGWLPNHGNVTRSKTFTYRDSVNDIIRNDTLAYNLNASNLYGEN